MKRIFLHAISFCLFCYLSKAQSNTDFKDGYALKGKDTVLCKVSFTAGKTDFGKSVKLIIDDEEITFDADGAILGFGYQIKNEQYDYGSVSIEKQVGNTMLTEKVFAKKIVTGTVELYEYSYTVYSTTRTTNRGTGQTQQSPSSSKTFTYNYIAKTEPASAPVDLSTLKKQQIAAYIADNAELAAKLDKTVSIKKLAGILKAYNDWVKQNEINQH